MRGTYSHSGKLGLGPVVVPLVGVVTSLILSLVYAYISVYSPIVGIVSVLVLMGYGFGLVLALSLAARLSKVRNTGFLSLVGALVGLFAVYSSWAAFMAVVLSKSGLEGVTYMGMLTSPEALWEGVKLINDNGWFSVKGSTPTGGVLWALWGVEALVIFGAGFFGGVIAISDSVFCEGCQEWAEEVEPPARFAITDDPALLERAAEADLDALAALPCTLPVLGAYLQTELLRCETCDKTATLQVKLVKTTINDKGEESEDTDDLSPQVLIGPEAVARIEQLALRPPAQLSGHEEGSGHEDLHEEGSDHEDLHEDGRPD